MNTILRLLALSLLSLASWRLSYATDSLRPFDSAQHPDFVVEQRADSLAITRRGCLVGEYVLMNITATVALEGDKLTLTVPGQPRYELVPMKGLSFDFKGLSGYSVEFKKDESGKIAELMFFQPHGNFAAKRK